jgi:hypothetical protein
MQDQIDNWLNALNEKANNHYPVADRVIKHVLYPGRKYIKVVREEYCENNPSKIHSSVHTFIEVSTGDIYKAASWKAPAKNGARFNVVNDNANLIAACDPYGGYLYKR